MTRNSFTSIWLTSLAIGMLLPCATSGQQDDAQQKALQALRRTVQEQERTPVSSANQPPPRVPTFEELERQYLEGKITARQFQQYVRDYKLQRPKPVIKSANPPPARTAPTNAATVKTGDPQNPDQAALNRLGELEEKMDQIIRERAERDKARTNAATATPPQTKRERLNELLRLRIEGKLTEAEYKERWQKIVAEKE